MVKNIIDSTLKTALSSHPRVFYKKRGTKLSSSSFSFDKIFKEIKPLTQPLRELRTGTQFVPRRMRLLKERVTTKIVKNIFKDNKSKNYFKKTTGIRMADYPEEYGKKGVRINISPNKFFELAQQTSGSDDSKSLSLEDYKKRVIHPSSLVRIRKGLLSPKEVVPIGWVELNRGTPESHEGRHRAKAAEELGYKTVPVVLTEKDEGYIKEQGPKLFEKWKDVIEAESPFKHDDESKEKVEWEKDKHEYYEEMEPDKYLKYTGVKTEDLKKYNEYFDTEEQKKLPMFHLLKKMEEGIKIEAPYLHGTLQEGKHRVIGAKILGEKTIPVAVNLPYEMRNKEVLDEFMRRAFPNDITNTSYYEEWRERFDKGYPHWEMDEHTFGVFLDVLKDKGINTDRFSKEYILYHGTKKYKLPHILKEGLKPDKQLGSYAIYLTPHKWRAKYYAKKGITFNKAIKTKPKEGVVLSVNIPEEDLHKYNIKQIKQGFPYTDIKVYKPIPAKNIVSIDESKNDVYRRGKARKLFEDIGWEGKGVKDTLDSIDVVDSLALRMSQKWGLSVEQMRPLIGMTADYNIDDEDDAIYVLEKHILPDFLKGNIKVQPDEEDTESKVLKKNKEEKDKNEDTTSKDKTLPRCFWCGKDISGIQPYDYEGFKFCSDSCVKGYLGYEK